MIFSVITIFPSLIEACMEEGIISRALRERKIELDIVNLRDYAYDRHRTTDDRPFGGGEGMVMCAEPLSLAVKAADRGAPDGRRVILLSPQGRPFTQRIAEELCSESQLILVCGRYEGVDERFRQGYVDDELSVGDFIVSGGELPALMIVDAVSRLIPGVLGCRDSAIKDTFSRNLLKHPQFTRPRIFEGSAVPDVLFSGNHRRIEEHRFVESVRRTLMRRPDLLEKATFSRDEKRLLKKHGIMMEQFCKGGGDQT
ncbi:MAG: tRNA (guanosine(37)-N1)-methyltransferase TrmD [Desulfofustis sp.]|jgi:tRNA (guanine37-N1)-methyltransferase|nr:tRNA (guanosine(37)-N1)-methyltransferase TrmD [Desulfofustis sp.]